MICPHCKSPDVRAYIRIVLETDPELLSSGKIVKKVVMDKRTEIVASDWNNVKVRCTKCRREV
ncbi:MAG: hypothetical protein ACREAU_01865 [Nitrosopumilaceae archaeon]